MWKSAPHLLALLCSALTGAAAPLAVHRAAVSCVSGCACSKVVADAHVEERHSLMRPLEVPATQHERCRVRVQVANETSFPGASSGHKFKVSSVMVRIAVKV